MAPPEESREDTAFAEPSEVVCPVCLRNNAPEAAFCATCGAPLGPVANIDPMQQIRAEGFAFRAAVNSPPRGLILIGTWLAMLPLAGSAVGMILSGFPMSVFGYAVLLLSVGVLVRATANFVSRKRAELHAKNPRV
jgi:hypothetical protein